MTKKTSTPRPAAPPVAYHHHPAPDEIQDVTDPYTYRSDERERLLRELRDALIAGAMGDALTNAKSGTTVTLRDGTKITRS
jgi:hypothetical protein